MEVGGEHRNIMGDKIFKNWILILKWQILVV